MWVWELPDGTFLSDGDGNHLCMNGMRHDLHSMTKMREAATYYGYPEGRPRFLEGREKVTQAQWEAQMEAFTEGEDIDTVLS